MLNNYQDEYEEERENIEGDGGAYTKELLNNFEFEIVNIDDNVKNKIKNNQKFLLDMKEYIYVNGLIQANIAKCVNVSEQKEKITIEFKLNDTEETTVWAVINLKDNTYKFSDNY